MCGQSYSIRIAGESSREGVVLLNFSGSGVTQQEASSCSRPAVRSGEDDGAVPVEQYPVLGVPAHRLRQHPALDVLALGLQRGHRVLVAGPCHVLLDDRALIEVRRHVVRRRPDELDPALVRLGVGARPLEGRQERVVDVDDAPVQSLAQGGGEDLHVAGQHHQLDVEGVHQPQQLGLGGLLG